MSLSWFFRPLGAAVAGRASARRNGSARAVGLRPRLEYLEDRFVPATTGTTTTTATHFLVLTPETAKAGLRAFIEVIALDSSNHRVANYTGTVSISSTTASDTLTSQAQQTPMALPTNYTFQASDRGVHLFALTPGATGSDTLTVTDTTTASITGSATLTVNPAPVATHLVVQALRNDYAGQPTTLLVAALDASNRLVPNYTGTVAITSTGANDTLPGNYTFQTSDHGYHLFTVTPAATGTDTFTATDTTSASITGNVAIQVTAAPVATHFFILVPPSIRTGSATPVVVVALDAANHIVPTYTGTIQLTSADSAATVGGTALPTSYTFQASDHGVHTFEVTFNTNGSEAVTATDTTNSSLTGTVTAAVGSTSGGFNGLGGFFPGLFSHARRFF
jgi:hypothetical protein